MRQFKKLTSIILAFAMVFAFMPLPLVNSVYADTAVNTIAISVTAPVKYVQVTAPTLNVNSGGNGTGVSVQHQWKFGSGSDATLSSTGYFVPNRVHTLTLTLSLEDGYAWGASVDTGISCSTVDTNASNNGITVSDGANNTKIVVLTFANTTAKAKLATPAISGTAKVGQTLSCALPTDKPAAELDRIWYVSNLDGTNLNDYTPTPTPETYTIRPEDLGKKVSVRIHDRKPYYQDSDLATTGVVAKGDQATPADPTVVKRTDEGIVLQGVKGAKIEATTPAIAAKALDENNQVTFTWDELDTENNTSVVFKQQYPAKTGYNASSPSSGLTLYRVKTTDAKVKGKKTGDKAHAVGYFAQSEKVDITADTKEGKTFKAWTSSTNTTSVTSATSSKITDLTIATAAIEATATYSTVATFDFEGWTFGDTLDATKQKEKIKKLSVSDVAANTITLTYQNKNASNEWVNYPLPSGATTTVPAGMYKAIVSFDKDGTSYKGEKVFSVKKKSIEASKLEISGLVAKTYNATKWEQAPTVKDATDENNKVTLTLNTDYTIEYGENINAGTGAGKVTVKSKGNYKFDDKTATFDINKIDVTITANAMTKNYGEANPQLTCATISNDIDSDNLPTYLKYEFYKDNKEITVDENTDAIAVGTITVKPAKKNADDKVWKNYNPTFAAGAVTINKADVPDSVKATFQKVVKFSTTEETTATVDVSDIVDKYDASVALKSGWNVADSNQLADKTKASYDSAKKQLKFIVKQNATAGDEDVVFTFTPSKNYNAFDKTIKITATDKKIPEVTITGKERDYKAGEAIDKDDLKVETNFEHYTLTLDPNNTEDAGDNIISVTFRVDSDDQGTVDSTYTTVTKKVLVKIRPIACTGEPTFTKITSSGKTLNAANIQVTGIKEGSSNGTGNIKWVDENGVELNSATIVEKDKAYKWVYTPSSTNYKKLSGAIRPWEDEVSDPYVNNSSDTTDTTDNKDTTDTTKDDAKDSKDGDSEKLEPKDITPKAAEVKVPTEVSDGTARVSMNASAKAGIEKASKEEGIVVLDVTESDDVVETSISGELIDTVAEQNPKDGLSLKMPKGTVNFDGKALNSLKGKEEVSLQVDSAKGELNESQTEGLGSQTDNVFDISMYAGTDQITSFDGGQLRISVPVEVPEGQNSDDMAVWHIAENGDIEPVSSRYNSETGNMEFTTTHLSKYAVVYFPFKDVKESFWGYSAIAYAYNNEMFSGVSKDRFAPKSKASRAMVVTVLYRLAGEPKVTEKANFSDVKKGSWYENAVNWASEKGVVNGVGKNMFAPNKEVTREQLITILYRYAKGDENNGVIAGFNDADKISKYAKKPMKWAIENNIIKGKGEGMLDPRAGANRAELAKVLKVFKQLFLK